MNEQHPVKYRQGSSNNGNAYKGVMLCNHPNVGGSCTERNYSGVKKQKYSNKENEFQNHHKNEGTTSFICGTVSKPWGSNVIIAEKSRVLSRLSKKDGALSKHKKWLHDMQQERERRMHDREKEHRLKEEKKIAFMVRQSEKRMEIIDEMKQIDGTSSCVNQPTSNLNSSHCEAHPKPKNEENEKELAKYSVIEDNENRKPVWALTESVAQEAETNIKKEEEDILLQFAEELDFERDYEDLELNNLMKKVRDRIRKLSKEKKKDEDRLRSVIESEAASIRTEALNLQCIEEPNSSDYNIEDQEDYDDVRSIAESVRSEVCGIRSVHSHKSIQALVEKSKEKLRIGKDALVRTIQEEEKTMDPPKIVTIIEDNGQRIAETKSLNKLPFKNRNPAL